MPNTKEKGDVESASGTKMFESATPAITQEQINCIKFSTLDLALDILAIF